MAEISLVYNYFLQMLASWGQILYRTARRSPAEEIMFRDCQKVLMSTNEKIVTC